MCGNHLCLFNISPKWWVGGQFTQLSLIRFILCQVTWPSFWQRPWHRASNSVQKRVHLARWPEWLHTRALWWMTTEGLPSSTLQKNCIPFPRLHCDSSPFYCSFLPALFPYLYLFDVISSLCLMVYLISFFLCQPGTSAVSASLRTSNFLQVTA